MTYVCTPWVHQTLVAYDADTLTELGRYQTESRYQAALFSDSLYATTAGRLGRKVFWKDDHETQTSNHLANAIRYTAHELRGRQS